jgi:hypothetical protein
MLPQRHFGLPPCVPEDAVRFAYGVADLRFFFTRCAVNLLSVGSDDNGNTRIGEPLRRRCRWVAASGVRFVSPDLAMSYRGYSLGLAQNQTGWSIIVMNLVGSACLQLGYLAGMVPSFLVVAARQSQRERPQPVRPLLHRRPL